MKFSIITAFPNSFAPLKESIVKRSQDKGLVEINIVDLRNFTDDSRKTIDDKPFGGGAGMLLQVEPVYRALKSIGVYPDRDERTRVLLTSARGFTWSQSQAEGFKDNFEHIVIICGHYEGVDHRVVEHLVDAEVSIGNFILSGGELASMIIVDSIVRLIPGVVGKEESVAIETEFTDEGKFIEYPHYSRPEVFKTDEGEEWGVPSVLLSGNHAEIEKWRKENTTFVKN